MLGVEIRKIKLDAGKRRQGEPEYQYRQQAEALERFLQEYRAHAAHEVEALKPYEQKHGYRF